VRNENLFLYYNVNFIETIDTCVIYSITSEYSFIISTVQIKAVDGITSDKILDA